MKILLHVGMPKCGSSALQSYLSSNDFAEATEGNAAYVALHDDGRVLWGDELIKYASASLHGYMSSHMHSADCSGNLKQQHDIRSVLKELSQDFDTLVFSNEGWGANPHMLADNCIFADETFDVSVLAYVRPQLEWLNSAWWQWGAWTDAPLANWVARNRSKSMWYKLFKCWQDKSWVNGVEIRLLDGDVVQDFMNQLGYQIPDQMRTNQSLPESVVRLFQRNRQLRPGPHDSEIEFALARHLHLDGGGSPWVLRPKMVENLLSYFAEDNKKLLEVLPALHRDKLVNDSRWWNNDEYKHRVVTPPVKKSLNSDALEELAVAAVMAVERLDAELRRKRSGD